MTIRPPSDAEQKQWPTSVIVPIDEKFTDERGEIIPLSDLTMDSAVMISSKKAPSGPTITIKPIGICVM